MDALFQDPGLLQDLALDLHEDLDLPSIQELFVYYDSLYFGSSLGTCVVEWSPQKMTRCAGICYAQPGGGCILRLSEPLLRLRPSWELKNTLIHEMIHAWLITRGVHEGNGGHGPQFQAKAQEINLSRAADFQRPSRGYDITIYHTMHNEVRFYQQHHWKCNACNKVICRAMNRKPQPADCRQYSRSRGADCGDDKCGYHAHLRRCPQGEFIKIKEPEGFSEKKSSKVRQNEDSGAEASKRPRNHPDNTRSITDFFKGPAKTLGGRAPIPSGSEGNQDLSKEGLRDRLAAAASSRAAGPSEAYNSNTSSTAPPASKLLDQSPSATKSFRQRDLTSFLPAVSPDSKKWVASGAASSYVVAEKESGAGIQHQSAGVGADVLPRSRVDHTADVAKATKPTNANWADGTAGKSDEREPGSGGIAILGSGALEGNCVAQRQLEAHSNSTLDPAKLGVSGSALERVAQSAFDDQPQSHILGRESAFVARTQCPLCGKVLFAVSNSDLNAHIDFCLQNSHAEELVVID